MEDNTKEMERIRSEFGEMKRNNDKFRTDLNSTLDKFMVDVLEKIKPPFSSKELLTAFWVIIIAVISIVVFINTIKSKSEKNEYRLDLYDKDKELQGIRYELTQEKLNKILTQQAEDKARQDANYKEKSKNVN